MARRAMIHDRLPWHAVYDQAQRWLRAGRFELVACSPSRGYPVSDSGDRTTPTLTMMPLGRKRSDSVVVALASR